MRKEFPLEIDGNNVFFQLPDTCTVCGYSIKPEIVYDNEEAIVEDEEYIVTIIYQCAKCDGVFAGIYEVARLSNKDDFVSTLNMFSPTLFMTKEYEQSIIDLSPQFVDIYNQSLHAEQCNLDKICGMGYRKALEFLVKDYVISKNPSHVDKIKTLPLATCIKTYIANDRVKILAEKSAWLGNDETHYEKRHNDYDINDLKKFIDALVHYISMELTFDEALRMPKA